jgi:hypothetical protein
MAVRMSRALPFSPLATCLCRALAIFAALLAEAGGSASLADGAGGGCSGSVRMSSRRSGGSNSGR